MNCNTGKLRQSEIKARIRVNLIFQEKQGDLNIQKISLKQKVEKLQDAMDSKVQKVVTATGIESVLHTQVVSEESLRLFGNQQQALKSMEISLQAQKIEAMGTLAGGIAHHFNNLLMGIQGRTLYSKITSEYTSASCYKRSSKRMTCNKVKKITS